MWALNGFFFSSFTVFVAALFFYAPVNDSVVRWKLFIFIEYKKIKKKLILQEAYIHILARQSTAVHKRMKKTKNENYVKRRQRQKKIVGEEIYMSWDISSPGYNQQ